MSAPTHPTEDMSREQFLAALDKEIEITISTQSATGLNRWAMILGLSGLLWLGLETWGSGNFSLANVAMLAITLSFAWNFILKVAVGVDRSLTPELDQAGRFIAFANLLGALRSALLFDILKQCILLALPLWFGLPGFGLLMCYAAVNLVFTLIVFAISYIDFPPFSARDVNAHFRRATSVVPIILWLVRLAVLLSVSWLTAQQFGHFSRHDIQLAVIAAAFAYVATLLVKDQFPTSHLAALKAVRQNLAFCRTSLTEARGQAELLLVFGGGLAQAFQRPLDAILADVDQIRFSLSRIDGMMPEFGKLASDLSSPGKRQDFDRLCNLMRSLYQQAEAQQLRLRKKVKRLDDHLKFATYFSPSSIQEAAPLIERLKAAIHPLNEQQKRIHSTIFANHADVASNLTKLAMPSDSVQPRIQN